MSRNEVSSKRREKVRNYAFILYEDSCKKGWEKELESMHVKALWIYHDQDILDTGELKKPHYHVMIMENGPVVLEVARSLSSHFGAANGYVEQVRDKKSYARYMCHLDQPDKYQYGIDLLQEVGGVKKMDLIGREKEDRLIIAREVVKFCRKRRGEYYCDLIDYCFKNEEKWVDLLLDIRFGRLIQDYVKSLQTKENNER